jgi:hypothetical protein
MPRTAAAPVVKTAITQPPGLLLAAVLHCRMQRQVDAGANTVSLKQAPYFYTVGMQCAST